MTLMIGDPQQVRSYRLSYKSEAIQFASVMAKDYVETVVTPKSARFSLVGSSIKLSARALGIPRNELPCFALVEALRELFSAPFESREWGESEEARRALGRAFLRGLKRDSLCSRDKRKY
jgi:hypothetical protein